MTRARTLADLGSASLATDAELAAEVATLNSTISGLALGKVMQVASTTTTSTFSTSSTSFLDWPGLSVTLTPTAASSKFLVMLNVHAKLSAAGPAVTIGIKRNVAVIASQISNPNPSTYRQTMDLHYLDSPGTVSAVTYQAVAKTSGGATLTADTGYSYTITALEIAA